MSTGTEVEELRREIETLQANFRRLLGALNAEPELRIAYTELRPDTPSPKGAYPKPGDHDVDCGVWNSLLRTPESDSTGCNCSARRKRRWQAFSKEGE